MPRGAPHARSCGQRVPGTASEIMQTRMNPTGQKPFPPQQGSPGVLRSEEPLMEEGRKRMPPVSVHRGPRKRRHGLREGAGRKRRQARHSPQPGPAAGSRSQVPQPPSSVPPTRCHNSCGELGAWGGVPGSPPTAEPGSFFPALSPGIAGRAPGLKGQRRNACAKPSPRSSSSAPGARGSLGLPPRDVIAQDLPGRGSIAGAGGSHTPTSAAQPAPLLPER